MRLPVAVFAVPDVRLADVVEHEVLIGKGRGERHRRRHLPRVDEDVVGQPGARQLRDAAAEPRPRQEVVRLGLHDVADADQASMARECVELRAEVVRLEVDPAHHAGDAGVAVGELEQPSCFLQRLPRLHRDARVDAGTPHHVLCVGRKEIAPQRGHRAIDPSVLDRVVLPEVQMSIDDVSGLRATHLTGVPPRALDS